MKNLKLVAVRDFIRQPYAWPGGYPKILLLSDGETLCAACARKEYKQISRSTRHGERDGWQAAGVDIHYEGEAECCAHCNAATESAYGVPDEVEQ